MATTVSRLNITLPRNLVSDLKETIPARARSKIIAEALREKIAQMKREESFTKLKGSWEKAGGIYFKSQKELKTWRKSLWSVAEKRFAGRIK